MYQLTRSCGIIQKRKNTIMILSHLLRYKGPFQIGPILRLVRKARSGSGSANPTDLLKRGGSPPPPSSNQKSQTSLTGRIV